MDSDAFQPGETIADCIRRICREIDSGKLKFDGPGMAEVIVDRSIELAHDAKRKLTLHSAGKQKSEGASVGERAATRRRSFSENHLQTISSTSQQDGAREPSEPSIHEANNEAVLDTVAEKPQTEHDSIREPAAMRHTLNTRRFVLQKGFTDRQLSHRSLDQLQLFLQDKTQGMEAEPASSSTPMLKGAAGKQMRDAVRKLAGLEMAENATAAIRVETEKMVDEVSAYFMG